MYKIEWSGKGYRQFKKIRETKIRERLYDAITGLEKFPDCRNVKKFTDRPGYRLRFRNWRVFFDIDNTIRLIEIKEVKKRDEHTYR